MLPHSFLSFFHGCVHNHGHDGSHCAYPVGLQLTKNVSLDREIEKTFYEIPILLKMLLLFTIMVKDEYKGKLWKDYYSFGMNFFFLSCKPLG